MPKIQSTPEIPATLRAYRFHGLDYEWREGQERTQGECPWCGRGGKFSIEVKEGRWRCVVCGEGSEKGGGNIYSFLRLLWDKSMAATSEEDYATLAANRALLYPETLQRWGCCKSLITGEWLVPGYTSDGRLVQLYRYLPDSGSKRMVLLATPTLGHGLFGMAHYDAGKAALAVAEGPWDGMALEEVSAKARNTGEGLELTAQETESLAGQGNVVAVPGCSTFAEAWLGLGAGKDVTLLYDNDHPKAHPKTGKVSELGPAGWAGMKRVAGLLAKAKEPPASLAYLAWGGDKDHDAELASGYDLRDALGAGSISERVEALGGILGRVRAVPAEWTGGSPSANGRGHTDLACAACSQWTTLVGAWRKAMKWTEGLDRALAVMLASVTSTKAVGDQLWVKIISPPSTGKSVLCEALSVAKKYVNAKSTIRGFHSGFKSDKDGEEDNSLIATLYDKTLIVKDSDSLLTAPNKDQILGEARDLYDSVSRTHYRNKMGKDYQGVRMTLILCGTAALKQLDSSELGERFLDCVIMDFIDEDLEDEILWRVVNRAERNLALESDGKATTQYDPDLALAMSLTGGYVNWLRESAQERLTAVQMEEPAKRRCVVLGKFVAYSRARPSTRQEETAEREFAARLVSQIVRLAKCLAVVLNRPTVDAEVLRRVTRVALDTSRGRTLEIMQHLASSGTDGLEVKGLAGLTSQSPDKERTLLRFLRKIGAVDVFTPTDELGRALGVQRWKLTTRMAKLYREVHDAEGV